MQDVSMNYAAILVAAFSNMVIGGLWYSPMAFVKPWMKMAGISEKQMKTGMPKAMVGDVLSSLLIATALACCIGVAQVSSCMHGVGIGFGAWLGFMLPIFVANLTYERKPLKMIGITAGYRLVTLLVMGAILACWQ